VAISSEDRYFLLFTRNIWIYDGARCCSEHLFDHRLISGAVDEIKPAAIRIQSLNSSDVQVLLCQSQMLYQTLHRRFDFDNPRGLSDDEYRLLTSLSREDFNDLIQRISSSGIRNSSNRSIRTAVGVFLCKLRLGVSHRLLASMFQLSNKRAVSKIIDSARQAILKNFVPDNLGFRHISRQEVIDHHTTSIARQLMCDGASDIATLVIDGTYIYIQVRSNVSTDRRFSSSIFQKSRSNQFQRKTFNLYKRRSLLKLMLIVSTSGYILACIGPFFSDSKNNDASIMKDILLRNTDNILNWVEEVMLSFELAFHCLLSLA
jgi:hypothetical protein